MRSAKVFLLIIYYHLKRQKKKVAIFFAFFALLAFLQLQFNIFCCRNTIRIGLIGTYQEHDLPNEVLNLLSRGLVKADEGGVSKPEMVSGWEVNNESNVFKFKLKDDLNWADNTNILASDVSFNIPTAEITTPDDKIIQFKLKESYSPFPSLLTRPIFKKGTLMGTGPYKIKKIEKSRIFIKKITLEPNNDNSILPDVDIRFYPNETVAKTGFNIGEVEALYGISNSNLDQANPNLKIQKKKDFEKIVTLLYFTKDPILSNRSFRQALSFQAPEISEEEIANNPFPEFFWVYDSDSKKYLNNTKEAKAAMERTKSSLDSKKLEVELVLTTTPNLEEVAKKIIPAWEELGIKVNLRVESGIPQNFQILLITQSIPTDPDQYFLWHSTQEKTNLSKYSSARVDKDLEDGRKTSDKEDRKAKYFDFQKTILEDAPATFLYFPTYNIVYFKKAEGNLNKILPMQLPNYE